MMYLGFDIGKRAHHAALLDADGHVLRRLRFAPARAGLADPAAWLGDAAPTAVEVGLEATGIYWLTLHAWLRQWGAAHDPRAQPDPGARVPQREHAGHEGGPGGCVAVACLLRWEGTHLAAHRVPEGRQAAAREVSRVRTEMIELRGRQLTKLGTVLEPLFPEFAAALSDLGSPSALAVLARWPTPVALAAARPSELTRVLHAASRGHLGAAKARELRELRERAAASVGVADPYGAAGIAVQTVVAHLEHLRAQIATLGERLDALQAEDAPPAGCSPPPPGFGRETVRT
jgi:hypothetical protein